MRISNENNGHNPRLELAVMKSMLKNTNKPSLYAKHKPVFIKQNKI